MKVNALLLCLFLGCSRSTVSSNSPTTRRRRGRPTVVGTTPIQRHQELTQHHSPSTTIRRGGAVTKKYKGKTPGRDSNSNIQQRKGSLEKQQPNGDDAVLGRKMALALVFFALFNDTLQITLLLPLLPSLIRSVGIPENKREVAMGVFYASKDVFQLIAAPLAGMWTASVGCQTALIVSTAALGLATILFGQASSSYLSLLMARSCQGAASAAILCAGLAYVAETHPSEIRGSAMGLATTGLALGVLCGPLAGGFLFSRIGQRATFQLAGAVVLFNAAAQLFLRRWLPTESQQLADGKGTKERKTSKSSESSSFLALLRNPDIMVAASSVALSYAFFGFIKPVSSMVLDEDFGMGLMERSWVITIATVAAFVGTPLAGWWSDRMQKSRLVAAGLGCMSASSLFFSASRFLLRKQSQVTTSVLFLFCVAMALIGFAVALQRSASSSLLADLVDKHSLGSYSLAFAIADMADSLGLIVGPVVGLTMSQFLGKNTAALILGGSCLALVPALMSIEVTIPKKKKPL